jgi:hypothetical protein
MIAGLSRSKQASFVQPIRISGWYQGHRELGGRQGPSPGAGDGIKRLVRVLGGSNHMLYGEANASSTLTVLYKEHVGMHIKTCNFYICICIPVCSS